MKVAIYIRVSTEEQVAEGYSISAQKQRLKAYCIAQDWDVVGFYVDEGISAKDMNRPQLQLMLEEVKQNKIDCVLVYRLDRLTRSVLDLYQILQTLDKHNCSFKSATEVYDTTTAIGRLFITIVAGLAQWERENTGERIKMGLLEKVRQGKYAQNQRPFGYNLDLKTGLLTINQEEAKIVRLIVDMYLSGKGANLICKYLNERAIHTRDGNKWNDKPLMQMLKNPLYKGTIRWGGIEAEDSVPPILTNEEFDMIQRTIENRRTLSPKRVSSDYIFSGKLKCNLCGNPLVGYKVYPKMADGSKGIYKNYRCMRKKSGECEGVRGMSERSLEQAFLSYIQKQVKITDKHVERALKENVVKPQDLELTKEDYEKEFDKIAKRRKKWQYAWSNDMISDEDFQARMNEEKLKEDELKQEMSENIIEVKEEIDGNQLSRVLLDISSNWKYLDNNEKKQLVQFTVDRIHTDFIEKKLTVTSIDFL